LKNKYYVLRHGRSIPNEEGLIVSLMSNGVLPMYGLAPSGVLQAKAAGTTLAKVVVVVVFCPSPLKSQKLANPTTPINPFYPNLLL
jgi:broad specificity phosphatase PhoE